MNRPLSRIQAFMDPKASAALILKEAAVLARWSKRSAVSAIHPSR
jgi:hypothetical protein